MQKEPKNSLSNDQIRISTQEIDEAVCQLQIAFGDGRLDEHDLDDRMKKALRAKTRGDLALLFSDLDIKPLEIIPSASALSPPKLSQSAVAILSGIEQKGQFILPKNYRVSAILGGIVLDLRDAIIENAHTEIRVTSILGGVEIIVPQGIRVQLYGTPILGSFSQNISTQNASEKAPIIHIRGLTVMGAIEIKNK